MLIRCEKCATLYELDDNMLPPSGAPVQCSRCQHVFTAYPGRRADGGAATSASAREERASELAPPDALTGSTHPEGDEHRGGEGVGAGQADRLASCGPSALAGEAEPVGSEDGVTASGRAGPALVSTGDAAEGAAEPAASAPDDAAGARPAATAAAGGTKQQRGSAPRASDGQSQQRRVNDGAGSEEPKFTADGRPIRKVSFPPDDAAAPRTSSARPSLQAAAPKGGERAHLPWLVPVVVALILAFAALVAWRLLAARATGEDAGRQPAEGHSSLLRGGRQQGARGGAPTPVGRSALAARDGNVRSQSCRPDPRSPHGRGEPRTSPVSGSRSVV